MTAPVIVQTPVRNRAALGSCSVTYGSNVTAGNFLIVVAMLHSRASSPVPTDSLGTTYVVDAEYAETAYTGWRVVVYRSSVALAAGGANTVTLARSAADEISLVAMEVSSLTSTPLDKTGSNTATSYGTGNNTVTSTGTLTQADELAITVICGRCNNTAGFSTLPAPAGGWTDLGTAYLGDGTTANSPCHAAYKIVAATTALAPVWAPTEATANATPFAAMLTVTYKGGAPTPNITSSSPNPVSNGSTVTLTGTTLKDTGDSTITFGGTSQTVTVQSATAPQFTAARGTNAYGVALDIVLTDSLAQVSNTYSATGGIIPQSGWSYVTLTSVNSTAAYRITAAGDLAIGDQIAYDNKSSAVTILPDGTFYTSLADGNTFDVEVWTTGSGWGALATQTIGAATSISGFAGVMNKRAFNKRSGIGF